MSDDLVNQLTLNFLINKQQLQKLNKKPKEYDKSVEIQTYEPRIKKLFSDLLVSHPPDDLLFDVKNTFDIFIEKSIYYLKTHDENERIEIERNMHTSDQLIKEDIDYEREERDIEKGNYEEISECEKSKEDEDEDEDEEDEPIIVHGKNKIPTNGVEDMQKLPLNWFENVRQTYKKNQIIPRKKEPTMFEPTFRDIKKKI